MPGLRRVNAWGARRPLPPFFADGATDMRCLRHALGRTIATGYTHHVERLMLLANFCLLAGIRPAAVTDWFLTVYVDAYHWVMQPNVMGMGLNADGGLVAAKPYVASAACIDRMSDYCEGCRYDRRRRTGPDACPFHALYWNFLLTIGTGKMFWHVWVDLAAAYAWRGQTAEAAAAVAEILKLRPGLTVQQMVEEAWEHSANVTFRKEYQRIAEGVRKAGLPER